MVELLQSIIYEVSYKELQRKEEKETPEITWRFKNQLVKYGTRFRGFDDGVFTFVTRSAEYDENRKQYTQKVELVNWEKFKKKLEKVKDFSKYAEEILFNDDLRIFCDCPDFRYRRAYVLTKLGAKYSKPETRPAKIRNPMNLGAGCKHLALVIRVLPFFHTTLAKILKDLAEKRKRR